MPVLATLAACGGTDSGDAEQHDHDTVIHDHRTDVDDYDDNHSTSANCSEARAAGAAPLHRGEPGYRSGLDRDGDGVACEG